MGNPKEEKKVERYLITGAAGQLGFELTKQLKEDEEDPAVFRVPLSKTKETLDVRDLNKLYSWLQGARPDAIINCASYTNVVGAERDPRECWAVNTCGTNNLACCASKLDIPLIQISTDFVFGELARRRTPYTEADAVGPVNTYGTSKALAEHAVLSWSASRKFPWWIIRTAGLFERNWRAYPNFPSIIYQALHNQAQPAVEVVDNVETNLTYAPDLAKAILWLLRHRESVPSGIYHITNRGDLCWYQAAAYIARAVGCTAKLRSTTREDYSSRQRRDLLTMPRYTCLSAARYCKLGGPPMPSWQDAIDRWLDRPKNAPTIRRMEGYL